LNKHAQLTKNCTAQAEAAKTFIKMILLLLLPCKLSRGLVLAVILAVYSLS
jgi:hypothetical protein